jgi:putative phosphoesterase
MATPTSQNGRYLAAVISDTHGRLSEQLISKLAGYDAVLHAGDIDTPQAYQQLARRHRLTAVRGNMDIGHWADDLPLTEVIAVDQLLVYMLHDIERLDLDPVTAGIQMIINGHTHRAKIERHRDGVLFINPGSASFPRHGTPPTMAVLSVENGTANAQIVKLN